jgi:hypothetical protein
MVCILWCTCSSLRVRGLDFILYGILDILEVARNDILRSFNWGV